MATTAADLRGQVSWPEPGARVRLTVPCTTGSPEGEGESTAACRVAGDLVEAQPGTVVLLAATGRTSFDLNAVSRIEVSRGSRSHAALGAAVGFVLGAGMSYFVLNQGGSTSKCDRSANQDAMSPGECLGAVLLGGVVGAGVGAGVGAVIRTERWESVPPGRLGLAVLPGRRVGVGVALKW